MKERKIYKFHYVYRITNITTGYFYYGSRSTNLNPSEDIGVKYFSSSSNKLFIRDQKENPKDYKYKIVRIYETSRDDAIKLEVRLHKKFDVKNHPKFINKANQTSIGFDTTGITSWNYGMTKRTSKILSVSAYRLSLYAESRPESHNCQLGRNQTGTHNVMFGKKHSATTKNKMSIKRKIWASNPDNIQMLINNGKKQANQMKNTIESNGKTQMQNSRIKQVKTVKETICDNGKTIEENSQLKRKNTLKLNKSNIGSRNPNAKYYKVIDHNNIEYLLWSQELRNWLKTNNIRPSDLKRCLNGDNILFSNIRKTSKFYKHPKRGIKIYEIDRSTYFNNKVV